MKKFIILLSLFFLALSLPLTYFVWRAYRGIEQQEAEELRYFATTLLNEMEEELVALTLREEKRAVDEYSYYLLPDASDAAPQRSPLSYPPQDAYILGYFQNNPDGSFQAPFTEAGSVTPEEWKRPAERLIAANDRLNVIKTGSLSDELETQPLGAGTQLVAQSASSLEQKYLDLPKLLEQKSLRSKETAPLQQKITRDQFANILSQQSVSLEDWNEQEQQPKLPTLAENFEVEVAPMQALVVAGGEVLIFRRVAIENQIYRQGFVLLPDTFLAHLRTAYFEGQPLAAFVRLDFMLSTREQPEALPEQQGLFTLMRTFPRPFSFIQTRIHGHTLPDSPERKILNAMRLLMALVLLAGLTALYQSARTIFELSERRSTFVSSVTHELKTPLTNIRMYAEMLEQGIAQNRDREEEYLRVIGSESQRLSRLIENVLDFSKLEKKQRRFNLKKGDFEDVLQEIHAITQEKLRQEGFRLDVQRDEISDFHYDREVMVQVLLNLIDNSVKFGKAGLLREITVRISSTSKYIQLSVSDTGPGIPKAALKKIFDDFYRGEHEVSRATRGTGIGLALVRKFISALGGSVRAENNSGPGCTIIILLPRHS